MIANGGAKTLGTDERFLDRIAAEAARRGLVDVAYGFYETAIGRLLVARTDAGLARIAFVDEDPDLVLEELAGELSPRVVRSPAMTRLAGQALESYLEGKSTELELPVDLALVHGPFRRAVLERLRGVRRGEVVTYRELATEAGRPRAVRAAGSACATNPVPIVVPCHRVVPSTGGLGGYGGGAERKRFLLELEGALPDR